MRKHLLVGVAVLALGSMPGFAADVPAGPVTKAPATAIAPLFNWSGFYYGINAGYGWGDSSHAGGGASSGDFGVDGWLVGGTAGANWQQGPWVGGVEADLAWANADGAGGGAACGAPCITELNWLGTGRMRAGYAADAYLFYVTGGVAFGGVKAGQAGFGSGSDTRVGWTAGGGAEAAVAQDWTAKVEYLYADLGDKNMYVAPGGPFKVDFASHIVRVGMNYKF